MKINICENLARRSVENHLLTYRHNRREDEMLEEKFSLYQRHIRLVDHHIHMAERRFEQHAKNDLGLVISYKRKPLEPPKNRPFYYASTNRNWTTKEYSVKSLHNVLEHKNLYEYAFERRSQKYYEELKEKNYEQKLRKELFMKRTKSFLRDDLERSNDWPTIDHARCNLRSNHHSEKTHLPKIRFTTEVYKNKVF
ncbi:unnamed protein product [Adineta steineri]|uniref:Uncharacterized protein n=1 Tax=Adineta steineri TaxID=433720 RepID=A0A816C9V5_9BILA|nr:unnamed protein product [Adineta steineri]CAF1448775.1 unnamed protein product [Adineta steineri]CAF1618662.1 unnamed protein product [Adineta steineri]CAF4058182.1 unnamed protein product [Adineta steineri]